jgi:hypothetical protein
MCCQIQNRHYIYKPKWINVLATNNYGSFEVFTVMFITTEVLRNCSRVNWFLLMFRMGVLPPSTRFSSQTWTARP